MEGVKIIRHNVQGVVILKIRIDTIGCKPSAQAISSIVLTGYRADNAFTRDPFPVLIDDSGKSASGNILLILPTLHDHMVPRTVFDYLLNRSARISPGRE